MPSPRSRQHQICSSTVRPACSLAIFKIIGPSATQTTKMSKINKNPIKLARCLLLARAMTFSPPFARFTIPFPASDPPTPELTSGDFKPLNR